MEDNNVRLIWITPEAERLIAYCARVSNPANQDNEKIDNLLKYCIRKGHWSIFEMTNMCIEIETSRAISAQILRHKSFSFQEFSQRYAPVLSFEDVNPRRQDLNNRQNSIDDIDEWGKGWFESEYREIITHAKAVYEEALRRGIAKESARFLLPMSSTTKLYMNGSIRSWIHYLQTRTGEETQLEHREIANQIKRVFCEQLPIVAEALEWS